MINNLKNNGGLKKINTKISWFYLIFIIFIYPFAVIIRSGDAFIPTIRSTFFNSFAETALVGFNIVTILILVVGILNLFNSPRSKFNIFVLILSLVGTYFIFLN